MSNFASFRIGDGQPQAEPGKRVNRYLGPEAEWPEHGFESEAEMHKAFADPRYETDSEFRDAVAIMIKHSNPSTDAPSVYSGRELSRAMSDPASARAIQDQEIYNERIMDMFNDPRYATSPSYRRQVEDTIRANMGAIDQAIGHRVKDRNVTKGVQRVQLSSDDYGAARKAITDERLAKVEADRVAAIQRAEARAAQQKAGIVGDQTDGDEE
jgi:hypothetical protein